MKVLTDDLRLGAPIGHFDRQAHFVCLYFVNALHLISHIETFIYLSFFTSTQNFRHFKKLGKIS